MIKIVFHSAMEEDKDREIAFYHSKLIYLISSCEFPRKQVTLKIATLSILKKEKNHQTHSWYHYNKFVGAVQSKK